jgi:hypothetical protein
LCMHDDENLYCLKTVNVVVDERGRGKRETV